MRLELLFSITAIMLMAFISCGKGGGENLPPIVDEPKDPYCQALIPTPERGVACLQCNHSRARAQALILSDTLLKSCHSAPSINYLIDGSFGYDPVFMAGEIDKLASGGRHPTIMFYLYNGASQRKYKSTEVPGFATTMEPGEFRHKIQHDGKLRDSYRAMVRARLPLFEHAHNAGARVILVIGLEDNLDDRAFNSMLQMTRDVVIPLPVEYARNPCKSCYDGNQGGIPDGVLEERHTPGIAHNEGGIVTNDGDCFRFDSEQPGDNERTLDDLRESRDRAAQIGATHVLWTAKYQGLWCRDNKPGGTVSPDDRNYAIPTEAEQKEIIRFLVN